MAEAPLVAVMPPGGDWPAELELTKDLRLISGCKSASGSQAFASTG
jgi:hypothetical protein